jgi:hypothetical protein
MARRKTGEPFGNISKAQRAVCMALVVKHQPSKHKTLNLNPNTSKK